MTNENMTNWKKSWKLICIAILFYTGVANGVYSPTAETTIRSNTMLATSYDPISRPNDTTEVKIGLSILAIDELNLRSQMLSMAGWITFEWEDYRLVWNPATNDDITSVFTEPAKVWKPEIVVDNSLADVGIISDSSLYLRVSSDGIVDWEPPRLFFTHCQVDIKYYPYDRQKCIISLASWGYVSEEVKLSVLSSGFNLDNFGTHGEWIILESGATATNISETINGVTKTFSTLEFTLSVERRTTFYDLNVVLPIILTSLLMMFTFIVPFESGEKLSYILTVFLALAVLLTIVSDALPPTSITTSVLALYLCVVTVLSSVGILLTVLLLLMYHREGQPSPSSCFYTFTRYAAKITCSSKSQYFHGGSIRKVDPVDDSDSVIRSRATTASNKKTAEAIGVRHDGGYDVEISWQHVATIHDRLCFIIFTAVTIIVNFSFLIGLVVGGQKAELGN